MSNELESDRAMVMNLESLKLMVLVMRATTRRCG